MPQVGFIRSKNEIKYLILFIAERLIAPVSFETIQELTMCDPAIDYFEFSECLNYLVQTGHMTCSKDYLYAITEKGIENGRTCAEEIPYSVRLNAEKMTEAQNRRIKRDRQVQSRVTPRANGTKSVELRLNDEQGIPLWRMELAVPDDMKAKELVRRFQEHPEQLYSELIHVLFPTRRAD